MNSDCPFCGDDIKKRTIDEGGLTKVVVSSPRLAYGHLLIMPKRHLQKYSELNPEEIIELMTLLAKYQDKILEKLSKGTEVRQNHVPYKENSRTHVNHFHFNLIPRDDNDEMSKKVDPLRRLLYQDVSDDELEVITQLLS